MQINWEDKKSARAYVEAIGPKNLLKRDYFREGVIFNLDGCMVILYKNQIRIRPFTLLERIRNFIRKHF